MSISKLKISDILNSELDEEKEIIITPFGKKDKVKVLGTVIDKEDKGEITSLYINDGSGTLRATIFDKLDIKIGVLIDLLGKVKKYNNLKYLSVFSFNKLEDPNWEMLRELEIIKEKISHSDKEEDLSDKEIVLKIIKNLDTDQGADYEELLEKCKLEKEKVKNIVIEFLKDGDIYEPRSGKLKPLK